MRRRMLIYTNFFVFAFFAAASVAFALDTVRTVSGNVTGKITALSDVAVSVEPTSGGEAKKIPTNQIVVIYFEDEPAQLRTAKNYVALERRYADGLNALERVKKDDISAKKFWKQEYEFYAAFASGKLALAGAGKVVEAGRSMAAFVKDNADSYHYFEACEILGDLLVANKSYDAAESYYAKLSATPWPSLQTRAAVAIGRLKLSQGKTGEALKAFEDGLIHESDDAVPAELVNLARLGKASVWAASGKENDALKLSQTVIDKTDPEKSEIMARAYLVQGEAYRSLNKTEDALLAFLHVDLLYASIPDAHAEALANLAELWEQAQKPDRAERARQTLLRQYKNSPWAKKLGGETTDGK